MCPPNTKHLLPTPIPAATLRFELRESQTSLPSVADEDPQMAVRRGYARADFWLKNQSYAEHEIISYVYALELEFAGTLNASVSVKSGSILVTIGLLIAAYELIAQYDDFMNSVNRLSGQITSVFQIVSENAPFGVIGPLELRKEISIEPKSTIAAAARAQELRTPESPNPLARAAPDMRHTVQFTVAPSCLLVVSMVALALGGIMLMVSLALSGFIDLGALQ